ncbi:MAG: PilT/PilU family type 4a pilus ATPase [Verrucomicrobiae bacterium]|nr:PilT/PilU family type 4a pilus ATPase [Verrucomicrobiae bacterium]
MELFERLLRTALQRGASDIHLKSGAAPVFRIARQLCPSDLPPPTEEQMRKLVAALLPPHLRERFEEYREADFSHVAEGIGRFRVNVFQQRGQLAIALRHVRTAIPTLDELRLPADTLRKIASSPGGIVLLAGAAGSGKSTTLAAIIEHINRTARKHIITLEDPIEYLFEDRLSEIEQREIGLDTASFETALRHVMRQDPDVIVIGEMRDAASFMAGLNAADTGHLVLTTLHANSAPQAIGRILDFFPSPEREPIRRQLGVTLNAVICQRLVNARAGGVVPAVEILRNNATVRRLFEDGRLDQLSDVIETGDDEMTSFNQSLHNLVKSGVVSEQEALAKSTAPQQLAMKLRGIFLDESRRILAGAQSKT